ncbi:hypothetical protein FLL84_10680 [Vibrio cholerae]|nr:hypothetical protein FLL69_07190 [Vibrio cholerae]TQQ37859.1 hypothetical protein FLL84_10680 [Vibrio cholerae]TQQ59761.1 hypothetical protein FLL63_11215 [Vibrio cholerae]
MKFAYTLALNGGEYPPLLVEPQWLIEFTSSIECLDAHRDEFTDRLPATPSRLGIDLMLG